METMQADDAPGGRGASAGPSHLLAGRRRAGVLCPLAALPPDDSPLRFLDWLAQAGVRVWQILPFDPPDAHGSPYSSISLNAGDAGLLPGLPVTPDALPWQGFADAPDWLREHALFEVARAHHGPQWCDWPAPLRDRDGDALAALAAANGPALDACVARQSLFFARLARLRREANARDILLFGDVALYPALDSVDVWSHRALFELDARGRPRRVAGVPPDYFSATGQYWGNPVYDWPAHVREGFAWWRARITHQLQALDVLRIDHFRGLQAAWCIPALSDDARDGLWCEVPGAAMLGSLPPTVRAALVAEDLGVITPAVDALRTDFDLPGMRVLQFAFSGDADNPHLPALIDRRQIVYTGTHDNDTSLGWLRALDAATRAQVVHALLTVEPMLDGADDAACVRAFVKLACSTQADTAIVPLQDVLALGSEARINVPGTVSPRNWAWRLDPQSLDAATADSLAALFAASGR